MSSRLVAAMITGATLFWRAGGDTGALTYSVASAAILYAMLHTERGRRILWLLWLIMLGGVILGFVYLGVSQDAFEALAVVLVWGATWFVEWSRLMGRVDGDGPVPTRRRVAPRQANEKTPHMDRSVGWRYPGMP